MDIQISELNEKISLESVFAQDIKREMARTIFGQEDLINGLLTGLISNGHILIEGVPGLAKTLTVRALAETINADFRRIQFTPDLLPADLVGTTIFNPKDSNFYPKKGPIFANIILADEINRAPAKVQSALLEAMQERQVTISGETFPLPDPFLVMATQNPIEQEGTYPLPEAQVDRFMLKINITYPSKDEEKKIVEAMSMQKTPRVRSVVNREKIIKARETADMIYVDEKVKNYVVDIVDATRNPEKYGLEKIRPWILYGASPRASIFLVQAAKAWAFIEGKGYVTPQDIKNVAEDVLRHRIIPTYEAEAENVTAENIVNSIFETVEIP